MQEVEWITVERPGYLGKRKDAEVARWDNQYGADNWRLVWELANGDILGYPEIFWKIYVPGYAKYFVSSTLWINGYSEARYLQRGFSYTYDKDLVTKEQAFDPLYLYNRPGFPNQFHHVALNIAIEYFMGMPFRGNTPLQVREGKPGTPIDTWPKGWKYSPGKIMTTRPDLTPETNIRGWWERGSIEEVYQTAKILQVKSP